MNIRHFVAGAALVVMMASCRTSHESLTYFNDISGIESGVLDQVPDQVTIHPSDELLITISSVIPEATAIYNAPLINPALSNNLKISSQPQQQTYIVNSMGDIVMPGLGKLHVSGMTTEQLTTDIYNRVSKDVDDPYVRVELLNFTVKVLGEVNKPGNCPKQVGEQYMTVLDALAGAGDMTEYSDRSNVVVLRRENDQVTYHRLNLNESSSMESPYFYLQQNDVVLVPPSKSRESNAKYDSNNSYKVSVVSTIVSAVSVLASLVIALAVK